MLELLSPAGSFESLEAAVRSGADAVYFGLADFNARRNATNFTKDEFIKAVNYCSVRGVKTNITFNTLIGDDEIGSALDLIETIASSGADAVIVQDLGIADLIRRCCPQLELHASTQMSVHSKSALYPLKEMGFSRVVLARELNQNEIAEIVHTANELGIETEVFVHGAHCMCVSGQCYFSGMVGQRSGNRGLCAQPCRLEYNGSYPLSMKDMCLENHIKQLGQMGVTSIKIEGRIKRPEYIAAATKVYYNAIRGIEDPKAKNNLLKVFSRSGHTDGYFTDSMGSNMFGIRSKDDVENTASVLKDIHNLYRIELQRVLVNIKLVVNRDEPIVLSLSDGQNTVSVTGDIPQIAKTVSVTRDKLSEQISKLGGTPFKADSIDIGLQEGLFVSAGEINSLRRSACDLLIEKRGAKAKQFNASLLPVPNKIDSKRCLFARFSDINQIPTNLSGVDRIYIPLGYDIPQVDCEVGVEIPRVLFEGEESVYEKLLACKASGAEYALCNNLAAVHLAERTGLKIHAGFGMNIYNSYSVLQMENAVDITLSFEQTLKSLKQMHRGGIIAYGRLPLMITRNCANGGQNNCAHCSHSLTDRKGYVFPIKCTNNYCEILNSKPLCITKDIDGFDFIELYFTDEKVNETEQIIESYLNNKEIKGDYTRGLYYRGVL